MTGTILCLCDLSIKKLTLELGCSAVHGFRYLLLYFGCLKQTVWTRIRLLHMEQSDLGLYMVFACKFELKLLLK